MAPEVGMAGWLVLSFLVLSKDIMPSLISSFMTWKSLFLASGTHVLSEIIWLSLRWAHIAYGQFT